MRLPRSAATAALLLFIFLAGCAAPLPPLPQRSPSAARSGPPDAPLVRIASDIALSAGLSAARPLLQGGFALDARLAMIANATTAIDVQTYVLADDATGRLLLRALRDAAARGVRVRLLLDDMHTAGTDRLLLGFAAQPNVELRLFNPFTVARDSASGRLLTLLADFRRLNHRMHNKLFVVDGAVAIVGGRNLADEYFLRSPLANFIDFDVLLAGAVVPDLSLLFDGYWNSAQAYPLQAIVDAGADEPAERLRAAFEQATRPDPHEALRAMAASDLYGQPPFSEELRTRRFHFIAAPVRAHADSPHKADAAAGDPNDDAHVDTVTRRFVDLLHDARREVLLFSPYFVPGKAGMQRIAEARAHGIEVRVVTNSTAASDEPLVNIGYERYRRGLLELGVQLYEISSVQLRRDRTLREALGTSNGRLHAKLGFIDRHTLLVGSMNLDPRSSSTNTEIGVAIESPALTKLVLDGFRVDSLVGLYEVQLRPDASGLRWTVHRTPRDATAAGTDGASPGAVAAAADDADESFNDEPERSTWLRLRLFLLSWLVPEALL